ncbi:hypothetical protein M0811_11595 [Anaeramoeba ignava]|uniref:Uncharacterized protein n=1 Tax=Anaeramoeba ignava TaxID=1746090 RepID=A0A9Q0LB14_ANAIG|nr:hypothetical protein M0811_11595 [Anaeramoeba ignava]
MKNQTKEDIWFCGQNTIANLLLNQQERITRTIQINLPENESTLKQISSGYLSTIFLFENGKAIEYTQKSRKPQQIPNSNISKVLVGYWNISFLTSNGEVFAKGKIINSTNSRNYTNISSLIDEPNDRIIKDIVCGAKSIYLLTSNQTVYGIGSNNSGQLGCESPNQSNKPIFMMKNVSKIFSGSHSDSVFLLNSNKELFGCGNNFYGQLGLEEREEREIKEIKQIENIPKGKIIDIQIGYDYSVMLIEEYKKGNINKARKLYECGHYQHNGLDQPNSAFQFTELKSPLFENDDILEFSVGSYHTLVLTSNHKLIGFGDNSFCQLGTGNTINQIRPIDLQVPEVIFDIHNYHVYCGLFNSFIYYKFCSSLQEDLIKLFRRKEFCDISFDTINPNEKIEAHKLILKYRLKDQNQIEKLQEIISKKSIKESNQIFEMIYSNRIIKPKLYSEIKEIINSNEKIEETMKRIYLNENEKDFIIERKEKQYKFPKININNEK